MESSRTLAEDMKVEKPVITFDYKEFEFAKNMKLKDKGQMDIKAKVVSESLDDKKNITKRIRILEAKLKKTARI